MSRNLFNNLKRPVIIAVITMRMVEASVNQIVHVVAMWNGGVAAIRAMNMLRRVLGGSKTRSALLGIGGINGDSVFIHVIAVRVMQMAVMKIIHVPFVFDSGMSASRLMDVRVVRVSRTGIFAHNFLNLTCFMLARFNSGNFPRSVLPRQEMFLQVTCI